MATPIGSTPDGGTIIQAEDGSTHVVRGNSVEPAGPGVLDTVGKAFPEPLAAVGGAAQGFGFDVDSPAVQRAMADSPSIAGAASVPGATIMGAGRMAQKIAPGLETVGLFNPATAPVATAGLIAQKLFPGPETPASSPGGAVGSPGQPSASPSTIPQVPQQPGAPQAPGVPPPVNVRAPQVGTRDLDAAAKQEAAAAGALGEAGAARAQAVGEETGKAADMLGQFRDQYLKRSQEIQADGAARLRAMDQEIEGIGKDQQKVDPDRWWNSRTEGGKVMGTIALALGGFASAFGAENTGGKMISDAIARDVDAQKFNIQQASQNRRDKLAGQQSAFGHFLQLTGNDQAAQAAATAWGLKQADMRIDALKSSLSAPEEIAKATEMQAQIKERIAGEKAKFAEINSNLTTQALQQEGMRQQMAYQKATRDMLAKGQVPPEMRGQAVYDSNGKLLGLAPTEKEAEGARKMIGAATGLLKEIEEAKQLAEKLGSSSNKTEAGATYKAKMDAIISKLNSSQDIQQAMDSQTRAMWMETLGNHATTPTSSTLAALNGLGSTIRTNANSTLRGFGPGMGMPYAEASQVGFKPAGGR